MRDILKEVLVRVDVLKFGGCTVPVWQVSRPGAFYAGPFVRYEDLPKDLAKAFGEWQMTAACPGQGTAYVHDFQDFMARGGRGWYGDWSEIVWKYR